MGVVTAALVTALAPAPARAEGYVSPWIGVNFANDNGDFDADEGRLSFGGTAGFMGAGILGFEADFGFAPSYFGDSGDLGDNSLFTAMGNIVVGIPFGGAKPFFSAGVGAIRTSVGSFSNTDFGFNVGAGLMGYFNDHVGLRADVRYFRNFADDPDISDIDFDDLNPGGFDFWRATIGVVLK
jgi:hypothetical protein